MGAESRRWPDGYTPFIHRILARQGIPADQVDDLRQNVLVKALTSFPYGHPPKHPFGWLTVTATHTAIDFWRQCGRDDKHLELAKQVQEHRAVDAATRLERNQVGEAVLKAVARLKGTEKSALCLYYLDDVPVHEIANRYRKSQSAVRKWIKKGLNRLRELVLEELERLS